MTTTKWGRGSPLPSEYQVQCPKPVPKVWKELMTKAAPKNGEQSDGVSDAWIKIKESRYNIDRNKYPDTLEIPYQDWADTLNGVVQQGYTEGQWVYIIDGGCRVGPGMQGHKLTGNVYQISNVVEESKGRWKYELKGSPAESKCITSWDDRDQYIRPATEEEIAQATGQSTEGWKIGDKLTAKWLEKENAYQYKKSPRHYSYGTDRTVEKVEDGWALISGTAQLWLPPKHLCTPLPTEWIPKVGEWVVVKDSGCCCDAGLNIKMSPTTAYQISESGVIGHYKWSYRLKNAPEGLNAIAGDGDPSKSIRAATPEEVRKAEGKPDKQYICTSEDGVKLYDKDEPFWVYNGNKGWVWKDKIALSSLHVMSTGSLTQTVKDGEPMWKVFSTESAAKAWIEQQNNPQIPVTKENARVGMKVVRGKDWEYGDQDGGQGKVGVIQSERSYYPINEDYLWVRVKWEHGGSEAYRIGDKGKYHLYIAPGESSTSKSIINSQTKTSQKQTSYEQANKQQQQDSSTICKGRNLRTKVEEHAGYQQTRGESPVSIRKIKPKIVEGGY